MFFLPLLLLSLLLWVLWGNRTLLIHEIPLSLPGLPLAFDGMRIAQVSDLHNASFGKENRRLLQALSQAKPHLIVLTGDLVDSRRTNPPRALAFAARAAELAPTYFVPGNHEARLPQYPALKSGLKDAGVVVLEDRSVPLCRDGETITLLGLADPSFDKKRGLPGSPAELVSAKLRRLLPAAAPYTILLSHRPELMGVYAAHAVDLVFSGHTHGGQVRLPLLGGVIAPSQGLFPFYDAGVYVQGTTRLIVSRGLGNSIAPIRLNNRPELVVARLSAGQ